MMLLRKAALLMAALWGSYFAVLDANLQPNGECSLLVLLPFTSTYVSSFVACFTLAILFVLVPPLLYGKRTIIAHHPLLYYSTVSI